MAAIAEIEEFQDELREWRRDLHAHPELGFEEARTADLVAARLQSFGVEIHRGLGKTGVVGTIRSGSGASIGLRADMDALPIRESNDFAHRSRNDGTMHACGHDGHTVMLLGAARYLAQTRNFSGTVHCIFQPGEEGLGGAKAMIRDGLFERFPCENIYAMHNKPGLPVGHFAVHPGPAMAGGAFFDIDLKGVGTHAARPDAGVDPILMAAQIVSALQSVVSRNLHPVDHGVLSVTQLHGGEAYNVIPETARISGTVRAFSKEVMATIERRTRELVKQIAAGFGGSAEIEFRTIFMPTVNDREQARFTADVCAELVGEERVDRSPPLIMASEDFSFMLDQVPGCYFNLGNGDAEGSCEVHNPGYDFNDQALALGSSLFARLAERRLA